MAQVQLQDLKWSHEAMIDYLLANPAASNRDLARSFSKSEAWVSVIINSDVFQAKLDSRREELSDPVVVASIKDRLSAVAASSLEAILNKLTAPVPMVSDEFLLKSADFATKALGYGAKPQGDGSPSVAVVVNVPGKASSAQEWLDQHTPPPKG